MTRGIAHPADYFYRRVFTDAVRLVDAVRTFDFVDPDRISVTGASQGGGISLAVSGLVPDLYAVMPDVPFLCDFRRSVEQTPDDPYPEIARYLSVHRDQVELSFQTLSYFDAVTFAGRASAPALFSVALMDTIVLPSSVYAAFNHYAGHPKSIEVYPFQRSRRRSDASVDSPSRLARVAVKMSCSHHVSAVRLAAGAHAGATDDNS